MQDSVFVPNIETMNKISIAHNKCDVFKNKKDKPLVFFSSSSRPFLLSFMFSNTLTGHSVDLDLELDINAECFQPAIASAT